METNCECQFVCLVPQKQRPKRVKAIYNCVADNPDELTFNEGEVIVVDGEEDQEWWVSVSERCRGFWGVKPRRNWPLNWSLGLGRCFISSELDRYID